MADLELLSPRGQDVVGQEPYDHWGFPDGSVFAMFYRVAESYLVRFPEIADFAIALDGRSVTCTPVPGMPQSTMTHLYLNQVQPLILSMSGKLVLHGSAVDIERRAIAFVGRSGQGKSTLAASFAIGGCPFLTDDGLVLEPDDYGYLAKPSHPSVRLWEDSREALLPDDAATAPPVHYTTKSRFSAGAQLRYSDEPRRLAALYFLGNAGLAAESDVVIRCLDPARALCELLQHSFILDVEDRPRVRAHFVRLVKLANEAACFHLDYPRCYEDLPRVLRAIRAHAASEGRRP